jgi:glycosyltransferase involved in cell wall biosynthesis
MNVLVFTSLYPNAVWPHHGVFVKERMTSVARLHGCETRVVAPVPYFPRIGIGWRRAYLGIPAREEIEGIEVRHPRYLVTPKFGMATYGLLMATGALGTVRRIHRTWPIDLIDAHYVYPDGFAAVVLGRLLRVPVVVSARGSDVNQFPALRTIRPLIRHTLREADALVAVCGALKKAMVALGCPDGKVRVIPNGVDARKFRPLAKAEARRQLKLPVHGTLVVSVGGLVPRKGFDLLIAAVGILRDQLGRGDVTLLIVGEGQHRPELERLIAQRGLCHSVYLVGSRAHEELFLWYSAADVFCLASSREGWPNVLLEALACGTPVVATDVWGVPEVIESDAVGLLSTRDERAIAVRLAEALERRWRPDVLRQYAEERTWDHVARQVIDVFQSVVSAKRSGFADREAGETRVI